MNVEIFSPGAHEQWGQGCRVAYKPKIFMVSLISILSVTTWLSTAASVPNLHTSPALANKSQRHSNSSAWVMFLFCRWKGASLIPLQVGSRCSYTRILQDLFSIRIRSWEKDMRHLLIYNRFPALVLENPENPYPVELKIKGAEQSQVHHHWWKY